MFAFQCFLIALLTTFASSGSAPIGGYPLKYLFQRPFIGGFLCGLILGDAAVSAGIVSPIMIIVVAISSIAGLVFSSIELVNALRIYKIILLLLSTLLGIYGVIIGTIYMIYKLLTLKVFGIPYLVPFVPFDKNEINDSFIKKEESVKKRNSFLTNNIVRGRYK